MHHFFRKTSDRILGLDISATSAKLLELSLPEDSRFGKRSMKHSQTYRAEAYATVNMPKDAVQDHLICDHRAVGEVIGELVSHSGTKLRKVAIAVAGSRIITKKIELPVALSASEIECYMEVEAESHIPYPLNEVALDFTVVGVVEHDPELVEVLLVACRLDNLEPYLTALQLAGLQAVVVDVECYALQRAFEQMCGIRKPALVQSAKAAHQANQIIAILDIGAVTIHCIVLANNRVLFSREQTFGGLQPTLDIQNNYDISLQEAGLDKKRSGLPDDYEQEVLTPFRTAVVQQVASALQFFFSASSLGRIDRIFLAGGGALTSGLTEQVQSSLNVPTFIANPLTNMCLSDKVNDTLIRREASALMLVCGLAMRSFD